MRAILITLICIILLSSIVSAEIIITNVEGTYSFGDSFSIPTIIKANEDVYAFFQMYLLCNSKQTEFYREYLILSEGEEKRIIPSVKFTKDLIDGDSGLCKIKATFKEDYVLTDEFSISNEIIINSSLEKLEFAPEENILIKGTTTKGNGNLVNGFIEAKIQKNNNSEMQIIETVNNGLFVINMSMPKDSKSQIYTLKILVYEKDIYGEITNIGEIYYNFLIIQVPTSLEIEIEKNNETNEEKIVPSSTLKVKAILKDQAGEKINSNAKITIKNSKNEILKEEEKSTDEYVELSVNYNEKPANWIISAISEGISAEKIVSVIEKEEAKIELINDTIILTNIGNVLYNKTVSVKINEENIEFNAYLKVDETKRYKITAPNGEYQIEINSREGEPSITGNAILTGKAIDIKEESLGIINVVRHPLVWIFIILIMGVVAFMFIRKKEGFSKEDFTGKPTIKPIAENQKRSEKVLPTVVVKRPSQVQPQQNKPQIQRTKTIIEPEKEKMIRKINPQNMASQNMMIDPKIKEVILSPSIQGTKQESSIICLKIKNMPEISRNTGVKEIMQRVINMAEERKAVLYNNGDYLFFILNPLITRTPNNEKTALDIARAIKDNLDNTNKLFREKIIYGISLNNGEIIASREKDILRFMGLGNVIILAKKIATISQGDILLSEAINYRLMSFIKTEKRVQEGIAFYIIREIKQQSEENKKFISNFAKRFQKN